MIFKQPTEKRKNAETSVKPSTWWERIVAPMLRQSFKLWWAKKEERNVQCLEYSECAETKF